MNDIGISFGDIIVIVSIVVAMGGYFINRSRLQKEQRDSVLGPILAAIAENKKEIQHVREDSEAGRRRLHERLDKIDEKYVSKETHRAEMEKLELTLNAWTASNNRLANALGHLEQPPRNKCAPAQKG